MTRENELKDFPALNEKVNKTPFRAPGNYFENFNSRLRDRIQDAPVQSTKIYLKPIFIISAAAILTACIFLSRMSHQQDSMKPINQSEVQLQAYLYSIDSEYVETAYLEMFHEEQEIEEVELLLEQLDEKTLYNNL